MSFERVALQLFTSRFASVTELSSIALGGRVVSVSDEFFAEAYHLLLVEPAPSLKGQFGPNGALYSGWETRRHNPMYDWCIIQLGTSGSIHGFDVDTANFNGNEAPAVSIHALYDMDCKDPHHSDARWMEILPKSSLGPDSRHLFKISPTTCVNYVKIHMYPDGGIARFRVYGDVDPVHPQDTTSFDLAHVFAGGRVLSVSDQHYGVGSNLILPGRGKNMGDGWETKRSRTKGHKDWAVIQLGASGFLGQVEIDTKNFLGNFPESCEIHAICASRNFDWLATTPDDSLWTLVLPRTNIGPDRQHYFELENVENQIYTHVKVTIYPDGGLKRVRILGRKAEYSTVMENSQSLSCAPDIPQHITIPVVPLTTDAYQPFGQVIQAYEGDSKPNDLEVTPANGGTAQKFHKLSLLKSSYPSEVGATTGISVYRCQPLENFESGTTVLKVLERHQYTSQAFIPMGNSSCTGSNVLDSAFLVVVAQNGPNDRPDMSTLRAFLASGIQGISYNPGIWHQPMTVLGRTLDLACVETQIGEGSAMDCEIVDLEPNPAYVLKLSQ